ncbi:thialysine N-epsilon-acetyltransferase [Anabrus simplex]|uniref:thialysine N-epsilon-acetyltransferase n=1 Tax=Anabrus simplex TaxID=316456 RepID=UPI0035A31106
MAQKLMQMALAASSRQLEAVKMTQNVLQRDGFDTPHPYFKCFVAELDPSECKNDTQLENNAIGGEDKSGTGRLVGYALYFFTYSTWNGPSLYLEDIYVTNDCRSLGIGSALFDRVAKEAFDKGCCRLDFVVLNWNPATEFYKRKGAVDLTTAEGWHHYRLEKEALRHLAVLKKRDTSVSP